MKARRGTTFVRIEWQNRRGHHQQLSYFGPVATGEDAQVKAIGRDEEYVNLRIPDADRAKFAAALRDMAALVEGGE